MMTDLYEASAEKTSAGYERELRAAVRGAWMRVLTYDQFLDSFGYSIERGLTQAWIAGAAAEGIGVDEFTFAEQMELRKHILSDRMFMGGFADQIFNFKSKDQGGKLQHHFDRLKAWVNHWWEVFGLARALAAKDKKMKFARVKATKNPCRSCLGLEGRVYRNSTWLEYNCVPPTRATDCGGYNCGHRLLPTDDRITPGKFPVGLLAR